LNSIQDTAVIEAIKKSISLNSFWGPLSLVCILWASASSQPANGDNWILEKDKDGIKVYTRKTLKSSLKDSKASVTIKVSAKKAFDLFIDFERHRDWMDRIRASRLLKKVSDNEYYVYYEVTAPWPVADRDVAVLYKAVKLPDGGFRLESAAKPDIIPPKEGLVRVPESESTWEFVPKGEGVEIIFTNHSDPGGNVPDWLINMTATDNPFNTLQNFRRKLEGD